MNASDAPIIVLVIPSACPTKIPIEDKSNPTPKQRKPMEYSVVV
jgi:hypothetical protein